MRLYRKPDPDRGQGLRLSPGLGRTRATTDHRQHPTPWHPRQGDRRPLDQYRRSAVRWERRTDIHQGFLDLAAALTGIAPLSPGTDTAASIRIDPGRNVSRDRPQWRCGWTCGSTPISIESGSSPRRMGMGLPTSRLQQSLTARCRHNFVELSPRTATRSGRRITSKSTLKGGRRVIGQPTRSPRQATAELTPDYSTGPSGKSTMQVVRYTWNTVSNRVTVRRLCCDAPHGRQQTSTPKQ